MKRTLLLCLLTLAAKAVFAGGDVLQSNSSSLPVATVRGLAPINAVNVGAPMGMASANLSLPSLIAVPGLTAPAVLSAAQAAQGVSAVAEQAVPVVQSVADEKTAAVDASLGRRSFASDKTVSQATALIGETKNSDAGALQVSADQSRLFDMAASHEGSVTKLAENDAVLGRESARTMTLAGVSKKDPQNLPSNASSIGSSRASFWSRSVVRPVAGVLGLLMAPGIASASTGLQSVQSQMADPSGGTIFGLVVIAIAGVVGVGGMMYNASESSTSERYFSGFLSMAAVANAMAVAVLALISPLGIPLTILQSILALLGILGALYNSIADKSSVAATVATALSVIGSAIALSPFFFALPLYFPVWAVFLAAINLTAGAVLLYRRKG
jgi:hypothetical protein